MRLNGQAILTSEGIRFKRKEAAFLNALGVGASRDRDDATVCWGVWLDTRDRNKFYEDARSETHPDSIAPDERQFPHLIVSPLHPSRWTSAFRIEAFLDRAFVPRDGRKSSTRDPLRAGYRLLEELNNALGVKTLRTEGGIAGYDMFVLNALCEIPELRSAINKEDAAHFERVTRSPNTRDPRTGDAVQILRENRMKEVGLKMVPALASLCAAVDVRDANCRGIVSAPTRFLNLRVVNNGDKPWFLSRADLGQLLGGSTVLPGLGSYADFLDDVYAAIQREKHEHENPKSWSERALDTQDHACNPTTFAAEELRRMLRHHGVAAISAKALTSLSYARLFSFPEEEPVRLKYRKNWGLTFDAEPDRVFKFLNQFVGTSDSWKFDPNQSHRVITAFHLHDNFVRLRFVRGEFAQSRMRVLRVQFAVHSPPALNFPASAEPRGVLRTAIDCVTADPFRFRVEKIVTRPIVNAPDHESGVISLLVKTAGSKQRSEMNWPEVEQAVRNAIQSTVGKSLTYLDVTSESWAAVSER